LSNTIYDKDFFQNLMKDSDEKRTLFLRDWNSVTDLEYRICDFYYDITKELRRNLSGEYADWGESNELGLFCKGVCRKEKELLQEMLKVRRWKLDSNFSWNENYKKQLIELNEKVMKGFSMAYDEARKQFDIMKERIKNNDSYLKGFIIEIKLTPFILEPNEVEYYLEERGKGIYYLLYNVLPKILWLDNFVADEDVEDNIHMRYENDGENYNINEYLGEEIFDDSFICWGMYDLFYNCRNILSWYDILKINEISVEVNVTNKHFIENIGKGSFWDDGIQSLSDNEAENIRQEYMSRISSEESGLPAEIAVEDINCWEKKGPFRRIKFQGDHKKLDYRKLYSMSIEENPRVLVKDAQIDLTDDELQQVKDYVSKNRKLLIKMAEGKISFLDYYEKTGIIKSRRKKKE
jgi:hypothetical protein